MHEATDRLLKLLAEHGGRLHLLLVRLTLREDVAEDLLQDLFLRLCRSDGMLGATRPEKYLFRTAINLAFEWRRKNRKSTENGWIGRVERFLLGSTFEDGTEAGGSAARSGGDG